MTFAESATTIREFFSTLFGNRRIELLERELAEARKERDYFRGKCDRLELSLLTRQEPRTILPRSPGQQIPAGRKTWQQVLRDDFERQQKEQAEKEAIEKTKAS